MRAEKQTVKAFGRIQGKSQGGRGRKIDKFNSVIDVMHKYRILDRLGEGVHGDLHKLRHYRDKVHIQDDDEDTPRDGAEIFVDELRDWALSFSSRT